MPFSISPFLYFSDVFYS